jgi:hypothetical protein
VIAPRPKDCRPGEVIALSLAMGSWFQQVEAKSLEQSSRNFSNIPKIRSISTLLLDQKRQSLTE